MRRCWKDCKLVVIPALREWVVKPLDSGLRRNDGGLRLGFFSGMARGLSGWQPAYFLFVVIPAKAGIQETGAVVNG